MLNPLLRSLRSGLSEAAASANALDTIDGVFDRQAARMAGLVPEEVEAQAKRISGYHKRRLIQTFPSGSKPSPTCWRT